MVSYSRNENAQYITNGRISGRSESKLISFASRERGWQQGLDLGPESSRLWRRAEKKAGGVAARLKSHQTDFDARNARVTLCKPSPSPFSSELYESFSRCLSRGEGEEERGRGKKKKEKKTRVAFVDGLIIARLLRGENGARGTVAPSSRYNPYNLFA